IARTPRPGRGSLRAHREREKERCRPEGTALFAGRSEDSGLNAGATGCSPFVFTFAQACSTLRRKMVFLCLPITFCTPGTRAFSKADRRRAHGIDRNATRAPLGSALLEAGPRQRRRFRLSRTHSRSCGRRTETAEGDAEQRHANNLEAWHWGEDQSDDRKNVNEDEISENAFFGVDRLPEGPIPGALLLRYGQFHVLSGDLLC